MSQNDKLYGLIGYPLSHSFSKKYFTEKFLRENITDCRYELFPISSINQLKEIIQLNPTLSGLNVTIPYKELVLPFLDEITAPVKEIKACNCIRIKEGKLTGFNTDVIGFEQMLVPFLQPRHQNALILGTGGAAKAVAWVLSKLGISYKYVSRTGGENKLRYEDIDDSTMQNNLLIINTTPLGMAPHIESLPEIPYDSITNRHLFVELIYNPPKTGFLLEAERRGATILNGMEMLVIQAEESWKIWNYIN